MNYRMVLYTLGWVLNFEAVCMLLPFLCGAVFHEQEAIYFIICALLCTAFGILLTFRRPKNKTMYSKEGFVIVAFCWIIMSIFAALPFVISKSVPSFINALFETVSGFTTTGATILDDIEALPKCMLFWRSFTHWLGGMGVLVFIVSILPLSGGNNLYLMKAESPGPSVSKLVPRIKTSAKLLYEIYTAMTLLEMLFLVFGGVSVFEAVTLSFSTAGTGGFATLNSSVAEYSSYVQIVLTVFMVLFGVNFTLYYLLLVKRFKEIIHSEELKVYLGIIICASVIICINVSGMFTSVAEALKHSAFQVAAIITTTGFTTVDFDKWPALSKSILVLLMFIGACAGSTGGGMKVSRILIALKSVVKELKIMAHPKSTHKISVDNRLIEHEVIRSVNVYIVSYAVIFIISMLIISLDNFSFTTNFTAVATLINNVGPGLEGVGPIHNFNDFSVLSKIVLIADMLIGRLEIFPILVLFSPYTWKR